MMSDKVKTELKCMYDFLAEANDNDVRDYLVLMSAVRGPDFKPSDDIKEATTALIRYKLFGMTADNKVGMITSKYDYSDNVQIRMSMPDSHFKIHAQLAFAALGLKWDEVNKLD